jgi:hypothetical protein
MATRLRLSYADFMDYKKHFIKTNQVRLALCATLLGALTGCVGPGGGPRAGYYAEPAAVVVQDDYVYYPNYECYYSISRHEYAYREGNAWVSRPAPRDVPENVLRASPSVKMDFHDSPASHHAAVAKQYPKNWKPSGTNPGQPRRDDTRDSHDANH